MSIENNKPTYEELKDGYDLWMWLAENPYVNDKEEWPEFDRIKKYTNCCPFCEYFYNIEERCPKCPLANKYGSCESREDPYDIWIKGISKGYSPTEVTEACLKIASVFKEETEKICP